MSKLFVFELEGQGKLMKAIRKMPQQVQDDVAAKLEQFVEDTNADQVLNTPVGVSGFLRGGNDFRPDNPNKLEWTLFNTKEYAPYVEFGTGGMVIVPKGLEAYAMQFKGKGIREVNLPARPFFFEPFLRRRKELIQNIKKALLK